MARITKKQAMLNTALVQVLMARDKYIANEMSKETLEYAYQLNKRWVMYHMDQNAFSVFINNYVVKEVEATLNLI